VSVGSAIWLYERPGTEPWQPGHCRWCDAAIVLVNPADYRRRRREVHYGDEHEEGGHECRKAMLGSRTWDARHAVQWAAQDRGALACVDCGQVVEEYRDERWHGLQVEVVHPPDPRVLPGRHAELVATGVPGWEADHEIPIEDGGEHTLENLRCRCIPCHRAKTAREATARAARRRPRPRAPQLYLPGTT
jgi:5-methylcytosine-specific restriction endonuclease McrA